MLSLVAFVALAAASPTALPSLGPRVQARATVQIIVGARLKLDGQANPGAPAVRTSIVHSDGSTQEARLIEFQ